MVQTEVDTKPRMTPKVLQDLCKTHGGFRTENLNDKLYAHRKGFSEIENLEPYTGLKVVWLEGNSITKIAGLSTLVNLKALHLNQNVIDTIENLDALVELDTLNLSNNFITRISGLEGLVKLKSLQLAGNQIKSKEDVEELLKCPTITVLDLSGNRIDDAGVIEVLAGLPELKVLNLSGNDLVSATKDYRRTILSKLTSLTYLDDKPVFEDERRAVNAWAVGGREAELAERKKIKDEEAERHRRNMDAFQKMIDDAREKKRRERIEAGLPPEEEDDVEGQEGGNGDQEGARVNTDANGNPIRGNGDNNDDDAPVDENEVPPLEEVPEEEIRSSAHSLKNFTIQDAATLIAEVPKEPPVTLKKGEHTVEIVSDNEEPEPQVAPRRGGLIEELD